MESQSKSPLSQCHGSKSKKVQQQKLPTSKLAKACYSEDHIQKSKNDELAVARSPCKLDRFRGQFRAPLEKLPTRDGFQLNQTTFHYKYFSKNVFCLKPFTMFLIQFQFISSICMHPTLVKFQTKVQFSSIAHLN